MCGFPRLPSAAAEPNQKRISGKSAGWGRGVGRQEDYVFPPIVVIVIVVERGGGAGRYG